MELPSQNSLEKLQSPYFLLSWSLWTFFSRYLQPIYWDPWEFSFGHVYASLIHSHLTKQIGPIANQRHNLIMTDEHGWDAIEEILLLIEETSCSPCQVVPWSDLIDDYANSQR
jgi:hypothetical protein